MEIEYIKKVLIEEKEKLFALGIDKVGISGSFVRGNGVRTEGTGDC